MALQFYYSGAVEPNGKTVPIFSRGRYVSSHKVPLYDVGLLYPPTYTGGVYRHRCLFAYSSSSINNVVVSIDGPYPSGRAEVFNVALGSSSPTNYVNYLVRETDTPYVVGSWSNTVTFRLSAGNYLPLWFRLLIPVDASPTSDSWFVVKVDNTPIFYLIYTYKSNKVQLPALLWQGERKGSRLGLVSSPISTTTPDPVYTPAGYLLSEWSSVLSSYPLTEGFAESDFKVRLLRVTNAIFEVWCRADALSRISSNYSAVSGDSSLILGIPTDVNADALSYFTSLWEKVSGDAKVTIAAALVERLTDALVNLSANFFTLRSDALTYLGRETVTEGDVLVYIATDIGSASADALAYIYPISKVLQLPISSNLLYGFLYLPPISHVDIKQPFPSAVLYATLGSDLVNVRVLEEMEVNLWRNLGFIQSYPNLSTFSIVSPKIRFRNESPYWALVIWAIKGQYNL